MGKNIIEYPREFALANGDYVLGTNGDAHYKAHTFKELWEMTGCMPFDSFGLDNTEYNWNTNITKIDTMSYLDRLKQNLENDIQHHERKIEYVKENLEKLESMEHLTNDKLYQFMQSFEIIKLGGVIAITVPDNYLISSDQEEILKRYVLDTNKKDEYSSSNLVVEILRTRIK